MAQATNQVYVAASSSSRPLVRNIALIAILLAAIACLTLIVREAIVGSGRMEFVILVGVGALIVAGTSALAVPKQDESFTPRWSVLTYLLLAGAVLFVPLSIAWATKEGFGLNPAAVPGLAFLICLLAPFAVSNQSALGLGSAIPKCFMMLTAMQFTDNSNWGIYSANTLGSAETGVLAVVGFSVLMSVGLVFVKSRMPSTLMLLTSLVVSVPLILTIEKVLVVLHVV